MAAVTSVPANPPNGWSITGDFTAISNVCPGGDRPVSGLGLHADTIARWVNMRTSELWINYVAITHGDAELTLSVPDQTVVQKNLSQLTGSPISNDACVRQALISAQLEAQLKLALTVRAFFPEDVKTDEPYALVFTGIQFSNIGADGAQQTPASVSQTRALTSAAPAGSSSDTDKSSPSNHTAFIIGGVLGGFIALLATIVALCWMRRKARKYRTELGNHDRTDYAALLAFKNQLTHVHFPFLHANI
ncbi:hypothetical protein AURDEDRAFT_173933 [Auricularia subglabra TFB-10046 SS5]|uniref:Mid2 domain-containing protein n=1 Tax=Auricularia subglabra (strain TFB-10046 / SS5) TaxID=717982 RepID=J0WV92_AURST|nr:hypothetical protein AURDEDRAFT_173933 [Auricularia subglabra TFB-10046 SS5]